MAATKLSRRAGGFSLLLLPGLLQADPVAWPDLAARAAAQAAHPWPTAAQLAAQPVPAFPTVAAAPAPRPVPWPHPASRARVPATTTLHIFITLAMPAASLAALVDDAARSGATLVLRGLKAHSLRTTLAAVAPLIGTRQVAWTLDPEAFTRFDITHAPSFVLSYAAPPDRCSDPRAPPQDYVRIAGDVSLAYALRAIAQQRPALAPLLDGYQQKLAQ